MCVRKKEFGEAGSSELAFTLILLMEFKMTADGWLLWRQQEVQGWSFEREQVKGLIPLP